MAIEIERRFLVDGRKDKPWRSEDSITMTQYYLSDVIHIDDKIVWNDHILVEEKLEILNITTWRIRKKIDSNGKQSIILTAKGRRIGATATEFEWELASSLFEVLELEGLPSITKTRFLSTGNDGLLWEVDEFEGVLAGLIIAEVELESESQEVELPVWVGLELTHLRGWSNSSLSRMVKDAAVSYTHLTLPTICSV